MNRAYLFKSTWFSLLCAAFLLTLPGAVRAQCDPTLGNDTTVCNNGLVLDAGPGFATYLWSTGDTTQTLFADSTGTYSVEVYDGGTCIGWDTIAVTVQHVFNDDVECAHIIPDITGGFVSADAAFTTVGATSGGPAGSCDNSTSRSVWFTFQAPDSLVKIVLRTGGSAGTMSEPQITLFDANLNELMCARQEYPADLFQNQRLQSVQMQPGAWYFIMVRADDSNDVGTFALDVLDYVDFDFWEGAHEIPHAGAWCSAKKEFGNWRRTHDRDFASCWSQQEERNVWFKFQAGSAKARFRLRTGGVNGSMKYPQMALWDAQGNELVCAEFWTDTIDMKLQSVTLTTGDWYYVSINNRNSVGGSFTICLDTLVDNDFVEGAIELPHGNFCSANEAFNNDRATLDRPEAQPSCFGSMSKNVWFKFQAVKPIARVVGRVADGEGSLRGMNMALMDDQLNEIGCVDFFQHDDDVLIETDQLTVNDWYFICVRNVNQVEAHPGTFTMCLDTVVSFDLPAGAIDITYLLDTCSGIDEFQNVVVFEDFGATPNHVEGSCWSENEVFRNVWFKYVAGPSRVQFELAPTPAFQGELGIRQPLMSLHDENLNEIACQDAVGSSSVHVLTADSMEYGQTYYLQVDDDSRSGHFRLCLDPFFAFKQREQSPAQLAEALQFRLFPNPANEQVMVEFTLQETANVSLTLYDLSGKAVAQPIHGSTASGPHRQRMDVSGLAPGAYLYVLRTSGTATSGKLLVH